MPQKVSKRSNRSAPKGIMHRINGHLVRVPSQPPEFVSRPWYNLTVRIDSPPSVVTNDTLRVALETQVFGTNAINNISIRLLSCRIWGALAAAPAEMLPLTVQFMDPSQPTGPAPILEQCTRYPDLVNRASVGYHYPEAVSNRAFAVLTPPIVPTISLLIMSGVGPRSVVYFNICWRAGTVPVVLSEDTGYCPIGPDWTLA